MDTRSRWGSLRSPQPVHYNAHNSGLEFGSNRVYAATHQFGRGKIPVRPFLGLGVGDRLEVLRLIEEWISRP
jgi:phage gpG-like protein